MKMSFGMPFKNNRRGRQWRYVRLSFRRLLWQTVDLSLASSSNSSCMVSYPRFRLSLVWRRLKLPLFRVKVRNRRVQRRNLKPPRLPTNLPRTGQQRPAWSMMKAPRQVLPCYLPAWATGVPFHQDSLNHCKLQ